MTKILSTINQHNYFIPKMNLKAIVATLEEKCPNLFDQVRAGSWLVAAGGPAANHSPATIGIGFIPVAGAGVAAGGARRATGRRTAGLDSIRWSGDWRRNVHPRYTARQPVTQPQWSDLKGKKSLHFVWTQSGGCSCSEDRGTVREALAGPSLALWSAVGLREQMI